MDAPQTVDKVRGSSTVALLPTQPFNESEKQ